MRVKELLFTGRLFSADEALKAGFLTAVIEDEDFFGKVSEIAKRISQNAPLTIRASKEALRRLNQAMADELPHDCFNDVITSVYGSKDFAEGVSAYLEKRPPKWSGV